MAIQNYADLLAVVLNEPEVEKGEMSSRVICSLLTLHGSRNQKKPITTTIFKVSSHEPRTIREISAWKPLDIVRVSGFIATEDIEKKVVCPHCGAINRRTDSVAGARSGGTFVYLYPIYAQKVVSTSSKEDAEKYLEMNLDYLNHVILIGNITKPPVYFSPCTHFQLAINRKYCPRGQSDIRERADFPWVYSYGKHAKKDYAALRQGSVVMVDGVLQSREYAEDYICSECGEGFQYRGNTLEILSFYTDYISNCDMDALMAATENADGEG